MTELQPYGQSNRAPAVSRRAANEINRVMDQTGVSLARLDGRLAVQREEVMGEVEISRLKVAGVELVTDDAMERLASLHNRRQMLAGGDPSLDNMLGGLQMGAAQMMSGIQQGMFRTGR